MSKMNKNEILENLFKFFLNSRLENLERDEISHCIDLKFCNDIVKEVDSI